MSNCNRKDSCIADHYSFKREFKKLKVRCNRVVKFFVSYFFNMSLKSNDILKRMSDRVSLILEKLNGVFVNQIKPEVLVANPNQGSVTILMYFKLSITI